jgi:ABC-type polysaccharide/polyol phosphate transport system ATPase subunit
LTRAPDGRCPNRTDTLVVYNISKWYEKQRRDGRVVGYQSISRTQSERTQGTWVLKGVSFGVKKGERLVILASANSGRSTLLKIIAGELQRTSGQAMIGDLSVDTYYRWTHLVGGKIGYCS